MRSFPNIDAVQQHPACLQSARAAVSKRFAAKTCKASLKHGVQPVVSAVHPFGAELCSVREPQQWRQAMLGNLTKYCYSTIQDYPMVLW